MNLEASYMVRLRSGIGGSFHGRPNSSLWNVSPITQAWQLVLRRRAADVYITRNALEPTIVAKSEGYDMLPCHD